MRVMFSTGVMGKDNSPFAPRTLHFVQNGYVSPATYSMLSLGHCLARLADGQIEQIEIIDEDNNLITIRGD